jgi:hypothetical protein
MEGGPCRWLERLFNKDRSQRGTGSVFRKVFTAGVNAATGKSVLSAFSAPAEALQSVLAVGEAGVAGEPLAIAFTTLQGDSASARSSALVDAGDISGLGGFVRDQQAAGQRERDASSDPDIFGRPPEKTGTETALARCFCLFPC